MADREGFERFFRERYTRLVRACSLVTLDPAGAEEIAAEAFSRLWPRWEQMRDDDHAGGYVFKSAMRLCSKRKFSTARESVGEVGDRHTATDETTRALDRQEVFQALSTLSVRQRRRWSCATGPGSIPRRLPR